MQPRPFEVVADDLTGAAEIAAIGHTCGLASTVIRDRGDDLLSHDASGLIVHDTDSRLLSPAAAAARVFQTGQAIAVRAPRLVYKKTDSVLRGPVVAEIEALAAALGRTRVLLVPANPALHRTIRDGRYFVDGTPLHRTAFASDPHHPARTSEVWQLLGPGGCLPVSVIRLDEPLPDAGLIVGEVSTSADIHAWAARVDSTLLPAGGAEFFRALLSLSGAPGSAPRGSIEIPFPVLAVLGSTAPRSREIRALACSRGLPLFTMPAGLLANDGPGDETPGRWASAIARSLGENKTVLVAAERPKSDDPVAIGRVFGHLVRRLYDQKAFRHLLIEGGATAGAILDALEWRHLDLLYQWAQGVVSLQPPDASGLMLTLKPGSYPWPDPLKHRLNLND
jgi:uncharacterized protein YgbK (DUF1537 family)